MADPIVSERAPASVREVAPEDLRVPEPAAITDARGGSGALRLAGLAGAAAAGVPPPLLGGDQGTVTSVMRTIQRTAGNRAAALMLERHAGATRDSVQRSAADGSAPAAGAGGRSPVLDVVGRGGGSTLDDATRTSMEQRFGGEDFRDVRVHTGEAASRSAEAVGANAYTVGRDIVVRDGQLSQHTLAHELTHVQQQRAGPVDGAEAGGGVRVSDPSDRFEQAAEQTAQRITSSGSAPTPAPPASAESPDAPSTVPRDHAVQRLVKPPDETAVVPPSGRKAPGAGNTEVASFIRSWGMKRSEKEAEPSKSEGIDDAVANDEVAAADEGPAPAADAGAAAAALGGGAGARAGGAPGAPGGVAGAAAAAAAARGAATGAVGGPAGTAGAGVVAGQASVGTAGEQVAAPAPPTGTTRNGVIEMEPMVITGRPPTTTPPPPSQPAGTNRNGVIEMEPMVITGTPPRRPGVIEMEPMVITGRPPTTTPPPSSQPAGTSRNGVIEMEPMVITGTPPRQPDVIEMEPMVVTGTPPPARGGSRADRARDRARRGQPGGGAQGEAPPGQTIEMEPLVITGTPPPQGPTSPQGPGAPGRPTGTGAPGRPGPTGVIEMEPLVITGNPPTQGPATPQRPTTPQGPPPGTGAPGAPGPTGVIEMEPMVITATPPGGGGAQGPDGAVSTGFKEKTKPAPKGGATGRGGPAGKAGGAGKPGAGAVKAGGGAGARKGGAGGGGGGGAPKPVPLGDPTLERWRSASATAVAGTKPGDLGEAKEGPKKVEAKGKETDASRKAAEPDYQAEAKSKTPPMPAEPAKEQTLNTGPADQAIESLKQAGSKRLRDQTLEPIGTPPAYPSLNPADYVPKNLRTEIEKIESELAKKDFKPGEKEALTKLLEKRKAQVAEIEKTGGKGTPPPSPTVTDKGPSSLEPPSPAEADVLGDAIARAIGQIDSKTTEIVKKAVAQLKGEEVPALMGLAKDEEATVKTELDKELRGIASAAGVTEEQLKAKIETQKQTVKDEAAAVEAGLAASSATAAKQTEQRKKDADEKTTGAKKDAQDEAKAKEEALQGPPDTEAIERKRDEYITKVQDVAAQAAAGYTSSLSKRESDLDQAGATQKGAIKQAADTQAAAIRRHWASDTADKQSLEALDTVTWGRTRSAAVDAEVRKLKAAAKAEKEGFDADVARVSTDAKEKVRDWAARQEGKERSWWDRLMDMITDWRAQSKANTDAWEKQRNADSRDAMMADLDSLTAIREAQATGNTEAANKEYARLDADQKALAQAYFKGGISSIEFVAQSTMNRIGNRRAPELATKMEAKAIADWDWMPLGQLAKAKNPSFNPSVLANKVKGGVAGWGTNESQVYAGLGGAKTAVERAALAKCYQALFHVSMEEDVKDDMEDHELERAKALMEGKSDEADAATIKEAIEGMGTDEKAIQDALRGKTPEELEAIKAAYFKKYGVELKTDISGDMEDAELDNALALADGDTDKADAAELEDAMAGAGTNEEKLKRVYERIREEEEARAKKEGLSPAELKKRILDRNARVKGKFGEKYGDLDAKLQDELLDGQARPNPKMGQVVDDGDLKVLDALQTGDPSKIDAAKAYAEHKSTYTSDDEIEKVVRNQRRTAELDVALEMKSDRTRLEQLKASGDISDEDYKKQSETLDKEAKDKDGIEKRTVAKAEKNMGALKSEYSKATDGRQTFDNLIKYETSGVSKDEIKELVKSGGKLSDAQELFYSVEGAGTDEDKIKEVLKGKTPKQIAAIKAEYARLHPGQTLEDDVLSDLSGREDLDVGHTLKYGDPDTFAQQLDEEKDPVKRKALLEGMKQMLKDRKAFEETGAIGSVFALGADPMNSADQLEEAVKRADLYNTALTSYQEKNAGKKPEEIEPDPLLTAAKANFEMTYGGAIEAQEQVRAQIDSYADAITQVGAAIAGIAVTVATFGAAGPVVAAMYGAAAAAAMTMALKAQLKGAAYSWEEAGVDLAVGAVDAAVSGLTAGLGKAVTGAMSKAVAKQVAKQAAKEGAEKASESVVKVWLKEAFEEVVENAVQAMPTAAVGAMLDDNTWKSGDPWGAIGSATVKGAATGAAVGVGMKGAKDLAGAGISGIKGALKGKGDVGGIKTGGGDVGGDVKVGGDADVGAPKGGEAGGPGPKETGDVEPRSTSDVPDKPADLPQAADPDVNAKAADEGKLPEGTKPPDPATTKLDPDTPGAKVDPAPAKVDQPKVDTPQGKVDPASGKVDADAAPPRKPTADDVGKALSPDDLKGRYGMPEANVKKISAVADEHGVIIDIRPTTPHAEPMLRDGTALPKPEKLKAKTISELDVEIGLGKKEDLGKVGFFEPKEGGPPMRPADFESMPADKKKAIDDRIKQRKEEFADFKGDMDKLVADKKIVVLSDGTVLNTGLSKGEKGLPFTGDHDVFDIRAKDGTKLTPEKYKEVRQALIDAEAGIMHGGVTGWEVDSPSTFNTPAGQKSYGKMVADHSPGGKEPLVRIGDGDPKGVWYEPATPRAGEAGSGVTPKPGDVPGGTGTGGTGTTHPDPFPDGPGPRPGGEGSDGPRSGAAGEPEPVRTSTGEPEPGRTSTGEPARDPSQGSGAGGPGARADGPGGGGPDGGGPVHPGGGPAGGTPDARFVETRIGTIDMNSIRSLQPAAPDRLVIDQPAPGQPRRPPTGPPNSVIQFDADTHLIFDAQGNLQMKVTRASLEYVPTGERTNTPHQVADALGIPRRIEPPPPREINIAHSSLNEPAHVVEGRVGDATVRTEAANYQNKYPPGSEVTYDGQPVHDYERAHMWGPGFGNESILGIMLAPTSTNQVLQNQGIEKVIRDLHKTLAPAGHVDVQVTARPHPGGSIESGEFLATVEYKVTATLPDGRTVTFEGGWDIDPPPSGRPHGRMIEGGEDALALIRGSLEDVQDLAEGRVAAGVDREPRRPVGAGR